MTKKETALLANIRAEREDVAQRRYETKQARDNTPRIQPRTRAFLQAELVGLHGMSLGLELAEQMLLDSAGGS